MTFEPPLTDVEVRVLGAFLEKERTTPDNYPMSINALMNACNQTSNREPVMSLDEHTVAATVDRLRGRKLARATVRSDARVTKYVHLMDETLGLVNRQLAALCVLMLRGPQTAGEIRTRTQRLYAFEDVDEVESTLEGLMDREPPLVVRLPRRVGQKEVRYAHLLGGAVADDAGDAAEERARGAAGATPAASGATDRIAALEAEVAALRQEIAALREELAAFRKQFE